MTGVLAGKVVLVAGASSGLGKATSIAAAAAGAQVILFARRRDALDEVAATIEAAGGQSLIVVGDATDARAAGMAVEQAVEKFGKLDMLVNSVGTNIKQRALKGLTLDDWHELLRINLDAAYVLTQAVLPTFRQQQDGLLLHVSSSGAKTPDLSGAGYQASTAGVVALAHATMAEERANGIRVTVVFPGLMDTPLVNKRPTPPTPDELTRALQPDDVAGLCVSVMALPRRGFVPELLVYPTRP